jgi:hypothetical protein
VLVGGREVPIGEAGGTVGVDEGGGGVSVGPGGVSDGGGEVGVGPGGVSDGGGGICVAEEGVPVAPEVAARVADGTGVRDGVELAGCVVVAEGLPVGTRFMSTELAVRAPSVPIGCGLPAPGVRLASRVRMTAMYTAVSSCPGGRSMPGGGGFAVRTTSTAD